MDGTAILIEGIGTANGAIIHNAMAIITYNKADDNYTFKSYLSSGLGGSFKAELIDALLPGKRLAIAEHFPLHPVYRPFL